MSHQTDEELMQLVQNGETDKSAILFERYQVKIYNYFLRNTFNKDLSMDLAQNTFLRMLKYRSSYLPNKPFRVWLYSIARNIFLDSTRSKFRNSEPIEKLGQDQQLENEYDSSADETLYKALRKLCNSDRELIEMSRFQELKYHEIAQIMNLTEVSVKVRIHRAIKKLRDLYFEENLNEMKIHRN